VSCLCELIDNTDEADKSKKAVEILFNLRNNERYFSNIKLREWLVFQLQHRITLCVNPCRQKQKVVEILFNLRTNEKYFLENNKVSCLFFNFSKCEFISKILRTQQVKFFFIF
jgi:hypothetical protein